MRLTPRVLSVASGDKKATILQHPIESAGGSLMLWFTTLAQAQAETIVSEPDWYVAVQDGAGALIA